MNCLKRNRLALLCLAVLLLGCAEESRWDAAQQAAEQNPNAVSESALPGSTFNKYFPEQGGEIDLVFKQEKDGFAQASLQRGGDPIGMLSISDTRNNPAAREKFATSEMEIGGYPAVVQEQATMLLVANRFQVQVRSEGEALPADDRADWLTKFDLAGLANEAPPASPKPAPAEKREPARTSGYSDGY